MWNGDARAGPLWQLFWGSRCSILVSALLEAQLHATMEAWANMHDKGLEVQSASAFALVARSPL